MFGCCGEKLGKDHAILNKNEAAKCEDCDNYFHWESCMGDPVYKTVNFKCLVCKAKKVML